MNPNYTRQVGNCYAGVSVSNDSAQTRARPKNVLSFVSGAGANSLINALKKSDACPTRLSNECAQGPSPSPVTRIRLTGRRA